MKLFIPDGSDVALLWVLPRLPQIFPLAVLGPQQSPLYFAVCHPQAHAAWITSPLAFLLLIIQISALSSLLNGLLQALRLPYLPQ